MLLRASDPPMITQSRIYVSSGSYCISKGVFYLSRCGMGMLRLGCMHGSVTSNDCAGPSRMPIESNWSRISGTKNAARASTCFHRFKIGFR